MTLGGNVFVVRNGKLCRNGLIALLALAPALAGCNSASTFEQMQSDLFSKDAQWFQRSGRLFIRNVSIDAPPLTPDKPVTAEDLVNADGAAPNAFATSNRALSLEVPVMMISDAPACLQITV